MAELGNVPWQRDFELGLGYDTTSNANKLLAVQFVGKPEHKVSDVEVDCLLVHSSNTYAQVLEAYSAVGLPLQGMDFGLTGDLSQRLSISRREVHAVVMANYQSSGFLRGPEPSLNAVARLILATRGPTVFQQMCGDRCGNQAWLGSPPCTCRTRPYE
jgi:hypothetical protein